MTISVFDLFSIGIGPSSSHTVGPMKAAYAFVEKLALDRELFNEVNRLQVELFGSLALTGRGHGTDIAVLNGLEGQLPETVNPDEVTPRAKTIFEHCKIQLAGKKSISFSQQTDLLFLQKALLPLHTNGMRFSAFNPQGVLLNSQIYYSIGGGFIVTEQAFGQQHKDAVPVPYPFSTAIELFNTCKKNNLTISELMLANEQQLAPDRELRTDLLKIADIMQICVDNGCHTQGILPGGLSVKRRAPELFSKMNNKTISKLGTCPDSLLWPTIYAMAVNEENAAGGRIVTAPTNGAAGIIPAVLTYYRRFYDEVNEHSITDFLLTAGAIALLYKMNASISGAEVGCQGEVGVACSMAAGALTAVLGGSLEQIENAAEMAMEHHLGLTCDPVAGLVQIPCIERNGVGAEKAIKLAHLALMEDGKNKKVPLDKVIETMFATGKDMMAIYKETSLGGLAKTLAVNIPEC
ncbi:L-serine ammonia-lyase [Candidatus Rickettsiella isopodorum]|uniref:L-serine dehydratase n=1 Tax=Candidatus Rickettsiella isopodorum TaxID=1225476 RepID=A0A1J8P7M6_9COXI|nr:L-serine ammonia-lyase [Candidatus Rickettsiella isopodorum]OIZ95788.1 L-serine ammonia-lyase [Candidatus Rickettsiella isopodorum]